MAFIVGTLIPTRVEAELIYHFGVFRTEQVELSGGEQEVRHAARDCASPRL